LDDDLRRWEVFASTGPGGYPTPSRLVFRCVTDRSEPSRAAEFQGGNAEAEKAVRTRSGEELRAWLERAEPLR
jgi:hypothetical protein